MRTLQEKTQTLLLSCTKGFLKDIEPKTLSAPLLDTFHSRSRSHSFNGRCSRSMGIGMRMWCYFCQLMRHWMLCDCSEMIHSLYSTPSSLASLKLSGRVRYEVSVHDVRSFDNQRGEQKSASPLKAAPRTLTNADEANVASPGENISAVIHSSRPNLTCSLF